MSGFLGTFANLTGYMLGDFHVESFLGRDANGFPKWKVSCKCGAVQILPHTKVAQLLESKAPQNLQCSNGECPASRTYRRPVSLADIRREERAEADRAARAADDARRKAAEQAAKDGKIAAIKTEYRTYWLHQIKTKIELDKIVTLQRWCQLSDGTRQMVLRTLKNDATAYFTKL